MADVARLVLSIGAAALFAGCGGSQLPIGAPSVALQGRTIAQHAKRGRSWMLPHYKVSAPLVYVTNFDPLYDAVTIYEAKVNDPSPIAVINSDVSQPGGDCVDADGTLYVTSEPGNSNGWVSEYALGSTSALRLITKGISTPAFCAIDGSGDLWVTNFGNATVVEYLKGATVPHFTISDGLTSPNGIAIDQHANIYVANLEPYGTSNVQVYARGKDSPSRTITDGVTWPVGIALDAKGTLYVTNDLSCNIQQYRAGKSHPYRTITKDVDGPVALVFAKKGRLYEVNAGASDCQSKGPWPAILEFPRHQLSPSKRTITKDLHTPAGITYYPPLLP